MSTVTVWILITISTGYYNKGSASVIAQFPTLDDCRIVAQSIRNLRVETEPLCTQAKVVKP